MEDVDVNSLIAKPASTEVDVSSLIASPEKKNSVNTSTTSTNGSQTVVAPLQKNGAKDNLLAEANSLQPSEEQKREEQFQQTGNTGQADLKAKTVKLADKQLAKNSIQTEAAKTYKAIEDNNEYPLMTELRFLSQDPEANKVRIEEIKNTPVSDDWRKAGSIQVSETQNIPIPNLKKSAYKTYGEMWDATEKASENFNKLKGDADLLDAELIPAIQQERKNAAYIPDGKDEQGNEYLKLSPMQSFVEGFGGSVDAIGLGLKKLNPLYSREELKNDLKIKYLRENVLFPKQADEAYNIQTPLGDIPTGEATGMLGGVTPLIMTGGAGATGYGALAVNALTFGTMDLGAKMYEGYVEAKGKNMSDDEAMDYADKVGIAGGIGGAVLGATMPAQGALGRKIFINKAEAGALKTFLAEQGVMVPAFMSKTVIDNLGAKAFGSERDVNEGVVESGASALMIGAMTHAIGAGIKLPAKTKDVFENTIAKNYRELGVVINKAVNEGAIDYATGQRIAEKAKAYETIGKELEPKLEAEILPKQIEIDNLEKQNEGKKGAIAEINEVRVEELNREIKEDLGAPLSEKEQKEYETIIAKTEQKPAEGKPKPKLTDLEKQKKKHYEKRIKVAEKKAIEEEKNEATEVERVDEQASDNVETAAEVKPVEAGEAPAETKVVETQEEEVGKSQFSDLMESADTRMVDAIIHRVAIKDMPFEKAVDDAIGKNRKGIDAERLNKIRESAAKELGLNMDLEKEISNYKLDTGVGLKKYKDNLRNKKATITSLEKMDGDNSDLIKMHKEGLSHMGKVLDYFEKKKTAPSVAKEETPKDYQVNSTDITMPDGEPGKKVSITKPDGEVVEVGNFYPEDVEKEAAKKIKGYKLQDGKQMDTNVPLEKPEAQTQDLTGKEVSFEQAGSEKRGVVQSIDEKGNYKIKDAKGINYTVKPADARSVEALDKAKANYDKLIGKIDKLIKSKEKSDSTPPYTGPTGALMMNPKNLVTAPMKALGFGDKLIASATSKIEDGIAKSFRRGMGNSNKYLSRASSEAQGLFKQLALTADEMMSRRKALGQMNAAPLKAVKFYQSGVDVVGRTPESLQNVHQVLDPEVYSKRGVTPKTEADLSPSEKQLFDLLRSTNDLIHDWHFLNGRISQETYDKNKGTYAPRFYDNIEFEGLPGELKEAFEDYAKQQNFSYVKERQAFEDVMGENSITEDPVYGTSMRLAQMLRNQAVMEYAADLNGRVKTYNEGDSNIPNSYIKLEGGGQFGNINTYGKLTNKYVPRDIAEDFKGSLFINYAADKVFDAFKWYDRLAVRQFLKKTKTLYNPITQLGNIGSNYVFAMMNGLDPLTYQTRKIEAAKIVKEKSDLYVRLVEEGILGTDITTKDLKYEAKGKPVGEQGMLSQIDDRISEFYGSRDDIAKVAAYLAHTKDYGRSDAEALKRVSEGFQNYNNVGRFYDLAAKTPVVGNPFIKFKGDLMRIMKNNFSQRPLTNIALLAGLNLVASSLSKWADEDETIKQIRERRKFIPKVPLPDALGGDIPLVWKTPIGEINAARYFSPFNIYDMGDKGSTVEEVTQFLPYQLKKTEGNDVPLPQISDPFLGVYAQIAFDKDFRGKPILDPEETKWRSGNATTQEKIQNAATFIARQQIPFFANADDMLRAYNDKPDYYGRNKDLKQALLSNMIKIQDFEKPEAIESLSKEIDYRLGQMDKLNADVATAKNLAEKNVAKINEREISDESKQRLIRGEYMRAENKIAELMDKQAEIKQQLIEPTELLKKIGGSLSGGKEIKSPKTAKTAKTPR